MLSSYAHMRFRFGIALSCVASLHAQNRYSQCQAGTRKDDHDNHNRHSKHLSRITFLGTGSSTGCPRPLCPMVFRSVDVDETNRKLRERYEPFCRVSNLAMDGDDPRSNKNYRNNPSIIITQNGKNIIIDVGKTFREGALRWFPSKGITSLDGIILTHHHMDAVGGLDDVRGFQIAEQLDGQQRKTIPMPIYLASDCLEELGERFPWLLGSMSKNAASDKPLVSRHVATFDVHVIEPFQPFSLHGLTVVPLPVMHGEDLVCLGFAFSVGTKNVVYLSDLSRMLPETLKFIQTKLPRTDVLIVDSLHRHAIHPVHFCLDQAVELAKIIDPAQCYLIGMDCDSFLPHEEENADLKEKYGNIQFAHDGLVIETT